MTTYCLFEGRDIGQGTEHLRMQDTDEWKQQYSIYEEARLLPRTNTCTQAQTNANKAKHHTQFTLKSKSGSLLWAICRAERLDKSFHTQEAASPKTVIHCDKLFVNSINEHVTIIDKKLNERLHGRSGTRCGCGVQLLNDPTIYRNR